MFKKVAAVTMVYKSQNFLRKWVDYNGAQFGRSSLYIVLHGDDEANREIAAGCNIISIPRHLDANTTLIRFQFLSLIVRGLLKYYKAVICTDCDELVIANRDHTTSLSNFILRSELPVIAPVGVHMLPTEEQYQEGIDWSQPVTEQIPLVMPDSRYFKPCVIKSPCDIVTGGHGVVGQDFEVDSRLMLLHLKYIDRDRIETLASEISETLQARNARVRGKMSYAWKAGSDHELSALKKMRARKSMERSNPPRFYGRLVNANLYKTKDGRVLLPEMKGFEPFTLPKAFVGGA